MSNEIFAVLNVVPLYSFENPCIIGNGGWFFVVLLLDAQIFY